MSKTLRAGKLKKDILKRINYVKGHLQGISRMVEKDKYCIDIIRQNRAVVSAVEKINEIILDNHLNTCVAKAIRGSGLQERKKKIKEILEIYKEKK